MDNEGSVFNEDSDVDESSEDSTSEDTVDTKEGSEDKPSDTKETEDKSKDKSTEGTLTDQEQKEKELTEKGTKLDGNPMSRVNQELANERAKIRQYEEVLNNPKLLKGYVAQFDKPEEPKNDEPEIRIEDIQTTEDLQKYQRQQDQRVDSKLKELDSTIESVKSTQKDTVVAGRIQSDINAIRESYPELNPKSPDYNKDLDQTVGELYEMQDFDPQSKSFKGQVSIKDIADKVMRVAGSSKKQGSTEAQTQIRDKRTGKAVSGASSTAPDESGMTAGQLIASRIKAARGR